jgi:hypothetical protein
MNMQREAFPRRCLGLFTCMAMLLSPSWVSAHALEAIVRVTENALIVEAGYDDDTPAPNAKVIIRDTHHRILYEGTTDERGLCTFSLPPAGAYQAEVTSTGHRAIVNFVIENTPLEYRSWRPNRVMGLILGVSGLMAAAGISWWRLRRRTRFASSNSDSSTTNKSSR